MKTHTNSGRISDSSPRAGIAKTAAILTAVLSVLAAVSLLFIKYASSRISGPLTAELYQDGRLTQSITLSEVTESYTFTVTSADGGTNLVEVRPSEIGIVSADCPDKLCVKQGFIHNSLLPITCLPNRLVIVIRSGEDGPDITAGR